jgi:uncharacterized protein (UPF0276 family)
VSALKIGAGPLGLGIGWRPELARAIDRRDDLGFVELLAENLDPLDPLPRPVRALKKRGVKIVLHSVSLSLGGADPFERRRVERLAALADRTGACLVSDHVCFVRARGLESGHLLPIAYNDVGLSTLVENVALAERVLPVPLALENIASFVQLPGATLSEPELWQQLCRRTSALLLLDVANLWGNALNFSYDPIAWLDAMPLHRLAYVHLAGGVQCGPLYHDTHAHPLPGGPLQLLSALAARARVPGAMLERDDHFPAEAELHAELDAIAEAA